MTRKLDLDLESSFPESGVGLDPKFEIRRNTFEFYERKLPYKLLSGTPESPPFGVVL